MKQLPYTFSKTDSNNGEESNPLETWEPMEDIPDYDYEEYNDPYED